MAFKTRYSLKCNDLECPVDRQTIGSSISWPSQHKNQHADLCASSRCHILEEDKCLFHPKEEKEERDGNLEIAEFERENMEGPAEWRFQSNFTKLPLCTLLISVTSSAKRHKYDCGVWMLQFRVSAAIYVYVMARIHCECKAFKYKYAVVISSSQINHRH